MPKLDARDVLAVVALALFGLAMWIDHLHLLPAWATQPVSYIPHVVLAYYFVDSFKARGDGVQAQPPSVAPPQPVAPAPTVAQPEA